MIKTTISQYTSLFVYDLHMLLLGTIHPFSSHFYRNAGKSFFELPTAAIAEPGPNKTCFACVFCISSIWARSVSKTTGANRTIDDVKTTHEAIQVAWYNPWIPFTVHSKILAVAFRTDSGNISVRPINRSSKVSSGSWKKTYNHLTLKFFLI